MAHHASTPQSVLDAPAASAHLVHASSPSTSRSSRRSGWVKGLAPNVPFVGSVQRDLLGSPRPDALAARRKARYAAAKAARR